MLFRSAFGHAKHSQRTGIATGFGCFVHQLLELQGDVLAGNDKLRIERELPEAKDRAQMVRDVLRSLGRPTAAAE